MKTNSNTLLTLAYTLRTGAKCHADNDLPPDYEPIFPYDKTWLNTEDVEDTEGLMALAKANGRCPNVFDSITLEQVQEM